MGGGGGGVVGGGGGEGGLVGEGGSEVWVSEMDGMGVVVMIDRKGVV